jgi:ketosteroid isomerase-like protein
MRLGLVSALVIGSVILAGSASSPTAQAGAVDQAIVKSADAYVKATLAGDVKAIVALYTDDAVEMPPDHPPIKGKAAIEQYYVKEMAAGKLTAFKLAHLEAVASGDVAYDVGTYTQTVTLADGKALNSSGKYTVILKRRGSDWKVQYAIYNGDQPAPAGPKP